MPTHMPACVALHPVRSIDRLVPHVYAPTKIRAVITHTHRLHCQGSTRQRVDRIRLGILGTEEIEESVRSGQASH